VSESASPLGSSLYFIDVLACMLFAITLALAGARFEREADVPVDLPRMERAEGRAPALQAPAVTLRGGADGSVQVYLEGELLELEELGDRLRAAPPPAVVVRSESSTLARVVAIAHEAGVRDIQIAYEVGAAREEGP
jgi:biopolymer transport protein ExbD